MEYKPFFQKHESAFGKPVEGAKTDGSGPYPDLTWMSRTVSFRSQYNQEMCVIVANDVTATSLQSNGKVRAVKFSAAERIAPRNRTMVIEPEVAIEYSRMLNAEYERRVQTETQLAASQERELALLKESKERLFSHTRLYIANAKLIENLIMPCENGSRIKDFFVGVLIALLYKLKPGLSPAVNTNIDLLTESKTSEVEG